MVSQQASLSDSDDSPVCAYCGRPVLFFFVTGPHGDRYHPECADIPALIAEIRRLGTALEEAMKEHVELREALKFYADEENWDWNKGSRQVDYDEGTIARTAIARAV